MEVRRLYQNWCSFSLDRLVAPSTRNPTKCVYFTVQYLSDMHPQTSVHETNFELKLRPHLYANAEWDICYWEKYWCGCVAEAQWTTFICAASIRWIAEYYLYGVGTSKKNTFAVLGVRLTRWTPNKPLFGIHSGACQSRMPRSHSWTDVDIPL